MKRKTLETAINEARRFLTRAESYLTEVDPLKKKAHLSGGTPRVSGGAVCRPLDPLVMRFLFMAEST